MHTTLSIPLTLASLALARTVVENSLTQTNPIEVTANRGPADDTPNNPSALSTSVDFSDLPTLTITDNVVPHCQTITVAGEPIFTIQTNTVLPTACTLTVYGGGSTTASGSTIIGGTQPTSGLNSDNGTSVVTDGPGTATGTAANTTSITADQGLPSSGHRTTTTGAQASTPAVSSRAFGSAARQSGLASNLEIRSAALVLFAAATAAVLL
ncbi:hypothetical protein DOTSEDRAFT_26661 [Dothistroma septosporum NZE10]|uniref:Uncharacterized protein n=1 Tax=Dothistroma septosporum (strain NZE10 / CBS 128990) TaxID=675120 RepID=N1PIX4_DOTSN|nr:hypothetical protein DOTSEDRAFT_26661 [Dothistroma septosporum NZE10]